MCVYGKHIYIRDTYNTDQKPKTNKLKRKKSNTGEKTMKALETKCKLACLHQIIGITNTRLTEVEGKVFHL